MTYHNKVKYNKEGQLVVKKNEQHNSRLRHYYSDSSKANRSIYISDTLFSIKVYTLINDKIKIDYEILKQKRRSGDDVTRTQYHYLENGKIDYMVINNEDIITHHYNHDGTLSEKVDQNSKVLMKLEYDDEGRRIIQKSYDESKVYFIEYENEGRQVTTFRVNEGDSLSLSREYYEDTYANRKVYTTFDDKNNRLFQHMHIRNPVQYFYDDNYKLIKKEYGEIVHNYLYNDRGHLELEENNRGMKIVYQNIYELIDFDNYLDSYENIELDELDEINR